MVLGISDVVDEASKRSLTHLDVRSIEGLERHVAAGLSNKQIARRLEISQLTVRNHLTRVFDKLGATNRTEAAVSAMRRGLVNT